MSHIRTGYIQATLIDNHEGNIMLEQVSWIIFYCLL